MNTNTPHANQSLAERLSALEAQLDAALKQNSRRLAVTRVVSVLVLVLVGASLFWEHKQVAAFDADTAAGALQMRAMEALPDLGQQLAESLKAKAPEVIDQAQARLMQAPHELVGVQLKGYLLHHLDDQLRQVEDQFYQSAKAQLDAIHAEYIKDSHPLTEAETTALLDQVITAYGKDASAVVDRVYADYAVQADEVIAYLHHLAENKQLTQREQIHRDMMLTFLAMMDQRMKQIGTTNLDWENLIQPHLEAAVTTNP